MERKIHNKKKAALERRAVRVRKRVEGNSERPRLVVFRSARHIYAQLVDDIAGRTLGAASTQSKDVREVIKGKKKSQASETVGKAIAKVAIERGIKKVVFDRRGHPYHGRLAALAKGAREGGLDF